MACAHCARLASSSEPIFRGFNRTSPRVLVLHSNPPFTFPLPNFSSLPSPLSTLDSTRQLVGNNNVDVFRHA